MNRKPALRDFDFSVDGDFRERLLRRIKAECFSALDDDALEMVNAAGVSDLPAQGDPGMIRAEEFGGN